MANTEHRGYPLPDETKNVRQEIENLQQQVLPMLDNDIHALFLAIANLAAAEHEHVIADITGLATALDGKMPANTTFSLADLTDTDGVDEAPDGYVMVKSGELWVAQAALAALGTHGHTMAQVSGLGDALDAKAGLSVVIQHDTPQGLSHGPKGQARANIGADLLGGFRNKIINGDMFVKQRGTIFSVPSGGSAYTADRWVVTNGTNQTATVQVFAGSPSSFVGQGNPGFLAISFSVAPSTGTVEILQAVEGVKTLAGEQVTLGARMALGSGAAQVVSGALRQNFGTGGSPSATVQTNVAFADTVTTLGTSVKATTPLPSNNGKTLGSNGNDFLSAVFFWTPRTTDILYFTHAFLVKGDATAEADPFSPRQIQQELALCQRYFFKSESRWIIYAPNNPAGVSAYQTFALPTTMRTTPTITKSAEVTNNASAMAFSPGPSYCEGTIVVTGAGTGFTYCNVSIDAEL